MSHNPTNIYRVRVVAADEFVTRKYPERFYFGLDAAYHARLNLLNEIARSDEWYTMRNVDARKVRVEDDQNERYKRLVASAKGNGVKYEVKTPWVELKEIAVEN